VVAVAAAPSLLRCLVPELEQDSYVHHLALPAQWLLRHRAVLTASPLTFHLPAPLECAWALPLVLGDERLAKVAVMACAAGACLVWAARARGVARWLGPVLAYALLPVFNLAATAKSDVAAAAMVVAGALLTAGGGRGIPGRTAGWALVGCGVAAKFVYAPIALVWWFAAPPRRGARLAAAALLLLPAAPWALKAWLATGDPVFPFGGAVFPAWD